jgi:hypothetical protein
MRSLVVYAFPQFCQMVTELVRLATEGENEATRIAAIKEVFDRAIGKAAQPVETEVQFGISLELTADFGRPRWAV